MCVYTYTYIYIYIYIYICTYVSSTRWDLSVLCWANARAGEAFAQRERPLGIGHVFISGTRCAWRARRSSSGKQHVASKRSLRLRDVRLVAGLTAQHPVRQRILFEARCLLDSLSLCIYIYIYISLSLYIYIYVYAYCNTYIYIYIQIYYHYSPLISKVGLEPNLSKFRVLARRAWRRQRNAEQLLLLLLVVVVVVAAPAEEAEEAEEAEAGATLWTAGAR